MQAPQTIPQYAHSTQVCEHIHTWKSNSLAIKPMVFQVRLVSRTWKSGTPTEHFQVRIVFHTWKSNSLAIKSMVFQVRLVSRTWKSGTPIEHSVRGGADSQVCEYART